MSTPNISCTHENTPGCAFCTTCGAPLDRWVCACGFHGARTDAFCGRCGRAFTLPESPHHPAATGAGQIAGTRYDLATLLASIEASERQEQSTVTHVNQDDIEAIIRKMRDSQ